MRKPVRILLICPFFGDLPPWWDRYQGEIDRLANQGYSMLRGVSEAGFANRVKNTLGIECPPMSGTGKIWDYRAALGLLYQDVLAHGRYDWWGHTDFDCVYGRVGEIYERFLTSSTDIFTDCAHGYIAGPWTLYRNTTLVNGLFLECPDWEQNLTAPEPTGWIEGSYSEYVKQQVAVTVVDMHAYTEPELLRRDGERLMHGQREIPYYHFRRTKEWPL